jgi:type IV secretory pathway VirB2 component (pilin)
MKNIIRILTACLFVCLLGWGIEGRAAAPTAPTPPAQAKVDPFSEVMQDGEKIVKGGTQYSQKMLFGLAGLGATATGAMAFFGRFRWNRFFILVGALLMIASAQYGIDFITGGSNQLETIRN